jgi:hypothetical protein
MTDSTSPTPAEHTALPWQLSGTRLTTAPTIGKDTRLLQIGPDGDVLALVFFDMKTGRGFADAKLIVAAVNERPMLLSRIRELEEAIKALMDAGTYLLAVQANKKLVGAANNKFMAALDIARAALQPAQEGAK